MSADLRALVIGTGYAGTRHSDALRELGIEVAGPVGAREAARDPSVIRKSRADVVHVCSSNDLHAPLAAAALEAGKHLICEKPLTLDLASAKELAELAERCARRGRYSFMAYNYRFYPAIWELIGRVAAGELGEIATVRASFLQEWLLRPPAETWRYDAGPGGVSRIVADLGSHCVDLVEAVMDTQASAVVGNVGEHHAALLVEIGIARAVVTLSQVSAGHGNDVELAVDGARGSAVWRFDSRDELSTSTPEGEVRIGRDAFTSPIARDLVRLPAGPNEARRNLIAAAYRYIRREEGIRLPVPTVFDGMRHVRLAAAALESHRERRWVDLLDAGARVRLEATLP